MDPIPMYYDGAFHGSVDGATFQTNNPFTGSVFATVYEAKSADVDQAVVAAHRAFSQGPWPRMSLGDRGAILKQISNQLKRHFSKLVREEIRDAGSTLKKATEDVFLSLKCLDYYAKVAESLEEDQTLRELTRPGISRNFLRHEPIGVCAAIIPWNFPLKMAIWKIAPALATGNTVVLKPSEETPLSALTLARLLEDTDLPAGVVNILPGMGPEAGEALASHPLVGKISFTGSTRIGSRILKLAAPTLKKVTLECGGKSANVVLDDAEMKLAVDGSLYAMFYHSGQCCEAGSRLFLPAARHDDFLDQMFAKIKAMKLGDPQDRTTDLGPLISRKQQRRVLGFVARGKREGAVLALGGSKPKQKDLRQGWFVEPTVFTAAKPEMQIVREEIFGPVLSVLTFRDEEELIHMVNDSPYGLGGGIWSGDDERALALAGRMRTGTVWINDYHQIDERAPFGGYKQSGIGREFGEEGLLQFTETKHIHLADSRDKIRLTRFKTVVPP